MESIGESRQTFALRGRPRAITLDEHGIHHPKTPRGSGFAYTGYDQVTHLATSHRALWMGTKRSVYVFSRRAFVDPHGPENLVRALLGRISEEPDGSAQLARMAEIEEMARGGGSLRATWGLGIVCLLVFLAQIFGGPVVEAVGHYSPVLVADGDVWRLVTANLLHAYPAFPLHLVLNLVGLLALGALTERSLGTARTLCVMGVSGVAAMFASGYGTGPNLRVVGVSGVVFGLIGAVTWLEFRSADQLPAWWRIPRRALITLLLINAALPLLVPILAGMAHLGGFVAGALVTGVIVSRPVGRPSPSWVRGLATAVVAMTVVAVSIASVELLRPGDALARHTARLGGLQDISPEELNDHAWFVAIDPDASEENLRAALELAERAVQETDRREATILDTLAEIQFNLGWEEAAVETIDEAIDQAPGEPYYREQRRRFLGERDRDDRPESPSPWRLPEPERESEGPEAEGITV